LIPCFSEWTRKENDETLTNSINQKHPAMGGGKKEQREREDLKSKPKDQNPKRVTKEHRSKSCSKAPTISRSIAGRERNEKE
jgi:uncharacterized protein with von Willebrand factor type A (vWA) domain